jgi:hypothetical protein
MKKSILAVALSLAGLGSAFAQVGLGPDFAVNTYTTGTQRRPAVGADASGAFVVVWESVGQDGELSGIFAQRYDSSGAPVGAEFRVNAFTTGYQARPDVAVAPTGEFVVVWEGFGEGSLNLDVWAQRYDAAGVAQGGNLRLDIHLSAVQSNPDVAMDASGNFAVAWVSAGQDGSGYGVVARTFDAAGVPRSGEFAVNAYTTGDQWFPKIASNGNGAFVVAWQSADQDGSGNGVFAQRFAGATVPLGGEFRANSYTTGAQVEAAVAVGADGRFMVGWTDRSGRDGSYAGVFAQAFDAAGVPVGPEFQANTFTTVNQAYPALEATGGGEFLVVWADQQEGVLTPDGNMGIFGRRFSAGGQPAEVEFQVNTYVTARQVFPDVAASTAGRFVVSWLSNLQDGDGYGIAARRMMADGIFADGFESGDTSAWSSAATDGGDLTVSGAAALNGTVFGLQGFVDDTAGLFVADERPDDENRYRARFYFDTNDFDPGEALNRFRTRILLVFEEAPTRRLAAVVLRRIGGAYSLMGRARQDDNSQANTGFFPITNGAHVVEIDWQRSSGPSAKDGRFELFLDGVPVSVLTGLDNSISSVDFVRLGALSVKAGASGTLFWDEFESRRATSIGP